MNERSLRVLEFTKIRAQLAQCCVSDMGRALCDALTPSNRLEDVLRMQQETEEAHSLLSYLGGTPMTLVFRCACFAASGADRFVSFATRIDGNRRKPACCPRRARGYRDG